jgi:two-component system nitrogen regulation sensor histidine kinase NtrY
MGSEPARRPISHERLVFALAVLAGLPGSLLGLGLLWLGGAELGFKLVATAVVLLLWLGLARAVRTRVSRSLLTLANMLSAIRDGDFSVRARGGSESGPLGMAMSELNNLTETLHAQRLGALEASALLRRVMAEIEVGIFAFDQEDRLRLINRHGERLLARPAENIRGRTAKELHLAVCLDGEPVRTIELALPTGSQRLLLRRSQFRQGGFPHRLLVLSDVRQALREEEHEAWRKLVRVLSHEINNSLAPVSSVAGSLDRILNLEPRPADWEEDLRAGLKVIAGRSEGLRRIMASYAQLAKLPPPRLAPVDAATWIHGIADLETRLHVEVVDGPATRFEADGDQLDQLLINLVRNAADAALETNGGVRIGWEQRDAVLVVWVTDDGPGISDPANLFVPFFTTKPEGSGIGLALCRQIAEGHGGELTLKNREDAPGCRAELRLTLGSD